MPSVFSTELLNDIGYSSQARNQNRQLIESENLDDYDDGFTRNKGLGGGQLLGSRPQFQRGNASPLIEEELPESKPHFMQRPQANAARQAYDRMQAAKKPWKKGMPYSQATLDTFDKSTPYEKKMFGGIRNARQAANLDENRPGGFQKLFGAKMSEDEIENRQYTPRAPKKSFWGRLKNAVTGGGRKRSWMEMFFGARKRGAENTPRAMGIKSTNAPMGVSSGWADQLVDAGDAGKLGEGRDASEQLLAAPGPQKAVEEQPAHQSAEHIIEEEEKQPPAMSKQAALAFLGMNAKGNSPMTNTNTTQNMVANQQANEYGNPHQTIDDNSVDEDDDSDGGYDPKLVTNFMHNAGKGDGNEEMPSFLQGYITSIFNQK
jgi:hypothetical protein